MKYTLTIEADTPEELSLALAALKTAPTAIRDSSSHELSPAVEPCPTPPKNGIPVDFPDWMDDRAIEAMGKWMAMRAAKGSPVKPGYHLNRLLGQLTRLHDAGHDAVAIVNDATTRRLDGFKPMA